MKKEEVEIVKQMIQQFIDDVERGKAVEEAGWKEKERDVEHALKRFGLYEEGLQGIRVSLHGSLPENLLKTEEGDMFSDMRQAIQISEDILRIAENSSLQTAMEISGFAYMLKASEFPVLSHRLFNEGFTDIGEWHTAVSNAVYLLTSLTVKKVWGIEDMKEVLKPLDHTSLPIPEKKNKEDAERVKRVLKWNKVLEILELDVCKALGFLWCVDFLISSGKIRYPESRILIQEKAWKLLEKKIRKSIQEIRKMVIKNVDKVEEKTLEQGFAIASWHEILRLPW
ncbi:MAG TPA: hypothetical protein ENG66_01945 [Thermococcus sp.]|nr:hypothetical protein [Thermococcus sp.]